jgi:hypothetical protein
MMGIFEDAKQFLRDNNIDQWQDNYPNPEVIQNDINSGTSYILE